MNTLDRLPEAVNRERLVDSNETAEFLCVSVLHLRRLYRTGKIPQPIKIGERKYGWRLGQLMDFVNSKPDLRTAAYE
jgi:predicted DNA-binding transcriptional regulator AlpA